jgi:hypothetical protein
MNVKIIYRPRTRDNPEFSRLSPFATAGGALADQPILACLCCIRHQKGNKVVFRVFLRTYGAE